MKELTIEEKAKRYDEAIERAKEMIKDMTNIGGVAKVDDIQYLFPELKESEDERIRKELLEHCKNQAKPYIQTGNKCPQIQSWIAWLEKQAEPVDEWSEEDKQMLDVAISFVEHSGFTTIGKGKNATIEWLKSLRPQKQWKPSDEQVMSLR